MTRLRRLAAGAILALGLVLPTVVGLLTPYMIIAIGLATFIGYLLARQGRAIYAEPVSTLFGIAFLVTLAEYAFVAQAPREVLLVLNFTMLALCGPISLLLVRNRDWIRGEWVPLLALAGVVLTLLMAAWFQLTLPPSSRRSAINLGPIVLANATLALAVVASAGAFVLRNRWSLLMPLTLVGGIAVALMGDSRGPLIGVVPLLVLTAVFLWAYRRDDRRVLLLTGGAALVLAVGVALLGGAGRVARLPGIIANLASGSASGDRTTEIRLSLYRAGWRAFLDAPWLGHGWARLMSSAAAYQDPTFDKTVRALRHLHNDVLDFAVAGGVLGVLVYLMIVIGPTVIAWRSSRDAFRPARLYAASALLVVYACGGLTDLMFGQEYHTALFVTLNAIVLGLIRAPDAQSTSNVA